MIQKKSHWMSLAIIVLAGCLTQFASDIYAPSLPTIATQLSTSISRVQQSMVIYLFGVAITQLIYGPVSEGVGRKSPMVFGLAVMLIGSALCAYAQTVEILILGRFIQGCGAGACAALWRTIFRDIFSGEEMAKYGSYLVILIMFIVPAAPALGGLFETYFNWRASFEFMQGYTALVLLLVVFGFKETSAHHHVEKLKWSYIGPTFMSTLKHKIFMGTVLSTFLTYGALFSWFVVGPVLLIDGSGISPEAFGLITCFGGGAAYALAGVLNGRLVTRLGIPVMLRIGWFISLCAGALLVLGFLFFGLNAWAIVCPALLFYFGSTLIWPNAVALAFTPFGKNAGYAGALYGSMQIAGGALVGGLMSFMPSDNQVYLGVTMMVTSILAWACYERIVNREVIALENRNY